ncbi:ROK family protein [Alkalicoccus urumqiensis]|uniref:ROK family protein n=1 Tax=Alkalicoccus urumqiensis TaxID=1548213 RepID=A0A2P6MJX5_ALKUR|nr:ROK family protein [Alkalicoccus urumqiensis]PRO66589.1 hypothetical protein C6I21_04395 [Alkalicoccus urumqiensis]
MSALYLAFDIGGTHVKWGILDDSGVLVEKGSFSSADGTGSVILSGIRETIAREKHRIEGVAVSAPGFIHQPGGYIERGGAVTEFDDFDLCGTLEKEFQLPVTLENDVNCAALAEYWLGSASGVNDFTCMTIGTGIGGAMVLNGALYRGAAFRGGEFGFMLTRGLNHDTPLQGSLSDVASIRTIRRRYAAVKHLKLEDVTGEMVFQAYDEGDAQAEQIIHQFYETLALGIFNLAAILNPEKILLGGGITSRPSFLAEISRHVSYVNEFLDIPLELCRFRNDAGLIGALAHFKTVHQRTTDRKPDVRPLA